MPETLDTFTNRTRAVQTVDEVMESGEIVMEGSWHFHPPVKLPGPGEYLFEHSGKGTFGRPVVGIGKQGPRGKIEWLYRKTDADIENERLEFRARMDQERKERLEENREDWTRREAALSPDLRARLENFRRRAGDAFDWDGWGYELVVCELTQLYLDSGGEDNDQINAYAEREGTSGNQHGYAKSLAKAMREDPSVAGKSVAALAPITGDPFYEKAGKPE